MKRQKVKLLIGLCFLVLSACKATHQSVLVADSYDTKKNQTILTILPDGNIVIPDKWTKTSYNQASRQHFFRNSDSTVVAVAKNRREKYPFYNIEHTDERFVQDFVKWDAGYWEKQGITTRTIHDQSENGYIIWQAKNEERNVSTIFLFGSKNGYAYNFSGNSAVWTEERITAFLIELYNSN